MAPQVRTEDLSAQERRDRRSARLTYGGLLVVLAVYLSGVVGMVSTGQLIWFTMAGASGVAAAILLFSRGYQVAIAAPSRKREGEDEKHETAERAPELEKLAA